MDDEVRPHSSPEQHASPSVPQSEGESDAGLRVAKNPLLSALILENLDIRCLHRARRTSREWNDLCLKISNRRKEIEYFCYAYDFSANSRNENVRPAVQLLHDNGRLGHSKKMLDDYLTEQFKKNQWCRAKSAFLLQGGRRTCMAGLHSKFREFLPPDCQVLSVTTANGFIPSLFDDDTRTFSSAEIQGRGQLVAGVSYMLWPDLGFDVTFFNSNSTLTEFDPSIENHKKLKGVIIFTNECMSRVGRREVYKSFEHVNDMFLKYERGFALGGVVVDDISLFPSIGTRDTRAPKFAGVAFSGENVRCASCVIDCEALDIMEHELRDFKQTLDFDADVMSRKNRTIGFLFTCSGRGPAMFKEANAEVSLINKVFPSVLFTGVYGDGEFGENFWPKCRSSVRLTEDEETGFWHFYTNVIVLVNIQL